MPTDLQEWPTLIGPICLSLCLSCQGLSLRRLVDFMLRPNEGVLTGLTAQN